MAHVGQAYPFLFERDLWITDVPRQQIAWRYKIHLNSTNSMPSLPLDVQPWISNPGVANYSTGEIFYYWPPGGWTTCPSEFRAWTKIPTSAAGLHCDYQFDGTGLGHTIFWDPGPAKSGKWLEFQNGSGIGSSGCGSLKLISALLNGNGPLQAATWGDLKARYALTGDPSWLPPYQQP